MVVVSADDNELLLEGALAGEDGADVGGVERASGEFSGERDHDAGEVDHPAFGVGEAAQVEEGTAIGIGGADMCLWLGSRRYTFRQIRRLVSGARITPVVDGSGLKNSLERQAVHYLQEHHILPLSRMNAFLVMAVDRFGMAQALAEVCARTAFGDVIFGLGLPIPIHWYGSIRLLGSVLLPIITRLPFQWFYPTGAKQETRQPRARKMFEWADLIAGDWHYIRRYMPDELPGKVILTNTIRKADLELLREAGVRKCRAHAALP